MVELFPFCWIAFGVAVRAFFYDAIKILLQTGDHAPRRFLLLFLEYFFWSGFGRPGGGVETAFEAHLHAAVRGDDADVLPAFAVDPQSLFLQGVQNIRPSPDKPLCHFFLEKSVNSLFGPVAVAFPDFLAPSRHSRLEQVGLFRKLIPCPCRVVGPRPAFAPVEQVAEHVKVFLPAGRAGIEIIAAGKFQSRNEEMQFVMSGMGMPHPKDIALIRFQSSEGHLLEGVHDFLFLFLADLLIWVPRQNAGGEFPSPLYAVDKRTSHGRIAAQYLRGACVSSRIIRAHKIAAGLVAFSCTMRKDLHQHGSASGSPSAEAQDTNSVMRRSMPASAVTTSTASAVRLYVLAHLAS